MKITRKDYKIIKTLSEDFCIIDFKTKDKEARKVVSFDQLERGEIIWDFDETVNQLRRSEQEMSQKIAQMNGGRH